MRLRLKDLKPVWCCHYLGTTDVVDNEGYRTGERQVSYSSPKRYEANLSQTYGKVEFWLFGAAENYSGTMVVDDPKCDIAENDVLFVDREPEFDADGNPKPDYIIKQAARSKFYATYAISKVDVS